MFSCENWIGYKIWNYIFNKKSNYIKHTTKIPEKAASFFLNYCTANLTSQNAKKGTINGSTTTLSGASKHGKTIWEG